MFDKIHRLTLRTLGVWLLLCLGAQMSAQENVDVRGMGFLGNLRLENRLTFLHGHDSEDTIQLDAAFLEDTAFILLQQVKLMGYMRPTIQGRFETEDGTVTYTWHEPYRPVLPAFFHADKAVFHITPGILYFYDSLEVSGIEAIPPREVRRYFVPSGALFMRRSDLAFTQANLSQRSGRLIRQLNSMGYLDARLVRQEVSEDHATGAVQVALEYDQGPLYEVREVTIRIYEEGELIEEETRKFEETLDTVDWNRDMRQQLMNASFIKGFPDVRVQEEILGKRKLENEDRVERDYVFTVNRGEKATIRDVRMEGRPDVKDTILRRQAGLTSGELLNFLDVTEGRRKIMALGVFSEVRVQLGEPDSEGRRDVIYILEPGRRQQLSLLAGWGSYDLARVGFRWLQVNPFHRANRYEIEAKQSIKTTDARATYTIPQIFGTELTAYSRVNYLYREEISFDREQAGVSLGTTMIPDFMSGLVFSVEYGLESQRTFRDGDSFFQARDSARVASLNTQTTLDRVDNVLFPTKGYRFLIATKTATTFLGGNVDFQNLEVGSAYHYPITNNLIFHVGLRYGVIFSWKPDVQNIPFSERYFLGGENTIRGYRFGQASPQDSAGERIGAETYLLGNIELEQRVVGNFSVVVFYDAANMSPDDNVFQGATFIDSVGAGISYRSIVGPIRLEYGYNLNRAPNDPVGTIQFAFGFPF